MEEGLVEKFSCVSSSSACMAQQLGNRGSNTSAPMPHLAARRARRWAPPAVGARA